MGIARKACQLWWLQPQDVEENPAKVPICMGGMSGIFERNAAKITTFIWALPNEHGRFKEGRPGNSRSD